MYILGISCFYHDSAAALIKDGVIVAAAQEERFTRKKHDFNFPDTCHCLLPARSRISRRRIFRMSPSMTSRSLKFERILETYLAYAPSGISSFLMAMPLWLKEKLWIPSLIRGRAGL